MTISVVGVVVLVVLGLGAGLLGALVGIGGGIVIVPALVLGFGYDIRIAVAASLISVVATSTAAGSAYVGAGLANMRLGMTLEIATTVGGITGGLVAVLISPSVLSALFAGVVVVTALLISRGVDDEGDTEDDLRDGTSPESRGWEEAGALGGAFYDRRAGRLVPYRAERLGLGSAISFLAGTVSGLLGVGGGFLKVPAMSLGMRVPIKVAAATSNFMIGVTAIASLFVYFARGYVHPLVAAPVALGVSAGAIAGAHVSARVSSGAVRWTLVAVLLFVAVQMALKSAGVHLGR